VNTIKKISEMSENKTIYESCGSVVAEKYCSLCKCDRPLSEFARAAHIKSGYRSECKKHGRERDKARREQLKKDNLFI